MPIACLPPILPIPYTPSNPLITYNWTSTIDVLKHLLHHPADRLQLLEKARRQNAHAFTIFWADHPLLRTLVRFSANDTDNDLFASIHKQVELIEFLDEFCPSHKNLKIIPPWEDSHPEFRSRPPFNFRIRPFPIEGHEYLKDFAY